MSTCRLSGIGTAVPQHTITQRQAIELTTELCCSNSREARVARTLHRNTKIQMRHTCVPYAVAHNGSDVEVRLDGAHGDHDVAVGTPPTVAATTTDQRMQWYEQHALSITLQSASAALREALLGPSEITHLITVSCTGFYAPGIDIQLIENLPLSPATQRVQVGFMGCHGGINGLRVARDFCRSDPDANVLLCCTELCSIHYHFSWETERFVGTSLFGDGSATAVLRGHDQRPTPELLATGSYLIPDTEEAMSWRIGDEGFEMTLSSAVPHMIQNSLRAWITGWLARHGHSIGSIGTWVVHPGGPKILDAVQDTLSLPASALEPSRNVLRNFGNMSSPTVFFIMQEASRAGAVGPAVVLGFGPGLMIEAALFG